MIHNTLKKLYNRIPAVQYGKKQEERMAKTEQGKKLLEETKTLKGRFNVLKGAIKKRFRKTSDGYMNQ